MYYIIKLSDRIRVPPKLFEAERDEAIRIMLRDLYKGVVHKDLGFIIDVVKAKAKGKGLVIPGDPNIYYDVEFELLTFSIDLNEVFRGKVSEIMEFGAFVNIGSFEGLLHISQISNEKFVYNKKTKSLVSASGKKSIKKGDIVYVKCSTLSMKGASSDVKISLSMRDPGLGKEEWLLEEKKKKSKKGEAKKK